MAKRQRSDYEYEPITRSTSYDEVERGNDALEPSDCGGVAGDSNDEDRRVATTSMLLLILMFLGILLIAPNAPPLSPPPQSVAVERTPATNISTIQESSPPPLSDVIVGKRIKSDVSWLLNFAVVGFPKCGTTFLKRYLGSVAGVYMAGEEWCNLSKDRPNELVELFYENTDRADMKRDVKRGFKCPVSLQSEYALSNLATYFDRTDFIVQVRHPILWFQSFYNFRNYMKWPQQMLPPDQLIGPCDESTPYVPLESVVGKWRVCTDRANFHHALSRLGKTPMYSPEEIRLLQGHNMSVVPVKGKIFLVEVGQLSEANSTRFDLFRETLRGFLGIKGDMPPFPDHHKPPRDPENLSRTMDICDNKHSAVRSALLASGKAASEWIREYFLKSPDVIVSSEEHFLELLQSWEKDPCDEKAG